MQRLLGCCVVLIFSLWLGLVSSPHAEDAERRIALVLGNAAYQVAPLSTSTNDAGLIAQTLQAAGFDVVGAAIWIKKHCGVLSAISRKKRPILDRIRLHSCISAVTGCSSKARIISSLSMPELLPLPMLRRKRSASLITRER